MQFASAQRAVWSSIMTSQIEKDLVLGLAVDYRYQNDAQFAKSVHINTLGAITIGDYSATAGLSGSLQHVSFTSQSLVLDQQKYFNMRADDVLLSATNIDVIGAATRNASYGLANVADAKIASLYLGFAAGNQIGSGSGVTVGTDKDTAASGSAYDYLVDLSVKLDENNAPRNDRFVVVPSWMLGMLAKDSRFMNANPQVTSNGVVTGAIVANMQVLMSNNLDSGSSTHKVMAFQKEAIAFAAGLNKIEPYVHPDWFGPALRGLYIYGVKVIQPTWGATLWAKKF